MPEHVKIGLIANLCMLFVFAGCMVYTTASKDESPPEPVYTECEVVAEEPDTTDLNRVDHERFPDTVAEVIYQKNQFSSMWNGRVDRCYVMDNIVQLVKEELLNRTNYEVMFFTAGRYSNYGTPMFQVEHHYFSSYD